MILLTYYSSLNYGLCYPIFSIRFINVCTVNLSYLDYLYCKNTITNKLF